MDGGNHCVLWVSVPHHPLVVGLNTLLVSRQQVHCEVQTFRQIAGSQLPTMASEGFNPISKRLKFLGHAPQTPLGLCFFYAVQTASKMLHLCGFFLL